MTHPVHRTRAFAGLRPQKAEDRRHYQRFEHHGLMARIGNKLYEVHDISIGGIRVERLDTSVGSPLALVLFPRQGRQLDLAQSMHIHGEVVGHTGGWTRIRFQALTYSLAKALIQQLARLHGVEPYIFK